MSEDAPEFEMKIEDETGLDDQSFCDWCQTSVPDGVHPDLSPVGGDPLLRAMLNPAFLEEFARGLIQTPTFQSFLAGGDPGGGVTPGDGGSYIHSLHSLNVKGNECKDKTPGDPVTRGHLSPEVRAILSESNVDPNLIRYMDVMTGYSLALNNPKSGDISDAPRLLKSFVRKEGFDLRFNQWLKNNPAVYEGGGIDEEMK
jgi:hypothetical protein